MVSRLPLETQTMYAELIERLRIHEAHRSIGAVPGSFTTKTVKGRSYLYFRYTDPGSAVREMYLGALTSRLEDFERRYREALEREAEEEKAIARLAALAKTGGAITTDVPSARLIRALADAGVFRLGGVLVGTHAFAVLGNVLGVRWSGSALRTMDVDVAATKTLDVAVPDLRANVPDVLDSLEMGFLPVPKLSPTDPSTSYMVRGQGLRIDLLTPSQRPGKPVMIHRLSAAAQPLKYLDYLIDSPIEAAVLNGGATFVNVPDPSRFALHKLMVAAARPATEHAKRTKDLWQADQVLQFVLQERPDDVVDAVSTIHQRGRGWSRLLAKGVKALAISSPDTAAELRVVVDAVKPGEGTTT